MKSFLFAISAQVLSGLPSEGAEVQVLSAGEGVVVFIDGEIEAGDLKRVTQAVEGLARATK